MYHATFESAVKLQAVAIFFVPNNCFGASLFYVLFVQVSSGYIEKQISDHGGWFAEVPTRKKNQEY